MCSVYQWQHNDNITTNRYTTYKRSLYNTFSKGLKERICLCQRIQKYTYDCWYFIYLYVYNIWHGK